MSEELLSAVLTRLRGPGWGGRRGPESFVVGLLVPLQFSSTGCSPGFSLKEKKILVIFFKRSSESWICIVYDSERFASLAARKWISTFRVFRVWKGLSSSTFVLWRRVT